MDHHTGKAMSKLTGLQKKSKVPSTSMYKTTCFLYKMSELSRMQVPQCARWSFSAATVHIDTGLKCIGSILLCTAVRQNDHRAHNLSDWFSRRGDHLTRYSCFKFGPAPGAGLNPRIDIIQPAWQG